MSGRVRPRPAHALDRRLAHYAGELGGTPFRCVDFDTSGLDLSAAVFLSQNEARLSPPPLFAPLSPPVVGGRSKRA